MWSAVLVLAVCGLPASLQQSSLGVPSVGPAAAAPSPAVLPGTLPDGFCKCNQTYNPVCGADGQTYGNACIMACENVPLASAGVCPACNRIASACDCGNQAYNPVCGDGLTFSTPCDARCNSHPCFTQGVCQYNPSGGSTPASGNSCSGGVTSAAQNSAFPSQSGARFNYGQALHLTGFFFDSMISGTNLTTQRLAWRGRSCFNCRGAYGEDLSGGYYESGGSMLKIAVPQAFTVTQLAWGATSFNGGFTKTGELSTVLGTIRHGAEYIDASFPSPTVMLASVGNDTDDFSYYGPPEEYHQYIPNRLFCYVNAQNPGAEIPGEGAAALAAASVALRGSDPSYASYLYGRAQSMYTFATSYQASYANNTQPCIKVHSSLYPSNGFVDELAWAAAWLYSASNSTASNYLSDARKYYAQAVSQQGNGYSYENGVKVPGLHVLLAKLDSANAAQYNANAKTFFNQYLTQSIPHTTKGLAYPYHWGAIRPATGAAFLMLEHYTTIRTSDAAFAGQIFNYAEYQIDYLLGACGRSLVSGFGSGYPTYVWHKYSYNAYIDWPLRGQSSFYGNVRGPWTTPTTGPDGPIYVQTSKFDLEGSRLPQRFLPYGYLYASVLQDDSIPVGRKDYTYTEQTTDGQTSFVNALAALAGYYSNNQTASNDCGLDLGWTHPNATIIQGVSVNNTAICAAGAPAPSG
ncbi:hypothetical protein WJX74_006277 [Apatococcus lobatus]|uniref:cellulase n=2 Tax=Apatococcus TaxID=904362 RepID=A0AAW1T466_9CHLO